MSHLWQNPYADTAFSNDPSGKKFSRMEDPAHLAFIRRLPSLVSGEEPCEACHVRYGDPKHRKAKTPKGRKPDDAWTVPLTSEEHRLQHSINELVFWQRSGIDPLEIAYQLYQVSGDLERGREIIAEARRNRR